MTRSLTLLISLVIPLVSMADTPARPQAKDLSAAIKKVTDELAAYRAAADTLAPRDAATQWLTLYDRTSAVWLQGRSGSAAVRKRVEEVHRDFLASLPPPATWRELSAQIDARPAPADADGSVRYSALRVLSRLLAGDGRGREDALQALRDAVGSGDAVAGLGADEDSASLDQLIGTLAAGRGLTEQFEKELELLGPDPDQTIAIPDLYRQANPANAEAMLKAAVVGEARIELSGGDYTDRRVLDLARKHVSSMKMPHFELVQDEAALDLFDEMERRFPDDAKADKARIRRGEPPWNTGTRALDRYKARRLQLCRLIREGRTDEAQKVQARLMADDAIESTADDEGLLSFDILLEDLEWTDARLNTVLALLKKHPQAPLWQVAGRGALRLGKLQSWIELADGVQPDVAATAYDGTPLRDLVVNVLLLADRNDDAMARLRRLPAPDKSTIDDIYSAASLAALGDQRKSEKDVALAVDWMRQAWRRMSRQAASGDDSDQLDAAAAARYFSDALLLQKKAPEAAATLLEAAEVCRSHASLSPALLAEALAIYLDAGKPTQAVELLDTAEHWHADDLVSQVSQRARDRRRLGTVAGAALLQSGKRPAGIKAIESSLAYDVDQPAAYRALLAAAAGSEDAMREVLAAFGRIVRSRPMSPLPLAWKAELLRQAGKLEAAEEAAAAAIAMGVTDEIVLGSKDLLQAHRTMVAVLKAQGRSRDAIEFAGAVAAADRIAAAKELSAGPALKACEEAAELFPAWVPLRLFLMFEYIDRGDTAKAKQEAQAAVTHLFKLPLERLESQAIVGSAMLHPVFRAEVERMAKARLEEEPADARASYLLGLAHIEASRAAEASVMLAAATLHQPKFAAAWVALRDYGATVAVRSDAALHVATLPGQIGRDEFAPAEVIDLRRLWDTVATVRRSSPPATTAIYPLSASKADPDDQPNKPAAESATPGEVLSQTLLLQTLRSLMFPGLPDEL
ncbi:hypothetical protein [Humisphaera borealis]|uniref:Tetratricopeptide repeat protein n=1 Tax=Humisphaera borealis TaxID=2807512 RepID=A0A7M2WWZ3_9BACT|nr:hypothetical protein [Humisphaera borealis]QOV90057.1 hypothetical protein IPV69_01400 [Humisphaera borealis]